MPIDVNPGESEDDFMARCIPKEIDAGKPRDQAVAICASVFSRKIMESKCDEIIQTSKEVSRELKSE